MTTVMTNASLISDIEIYLDRNDATLVSMIPEFITLAELRCAREVKNLGMKTCVTAVMLPGQYIYVKPNRWLETISINYGTATLFNSVSRQAIGGVVTITLAQQHNLTVGSTVIVMNMGNSNYNGTYQITAVTQYSITYTKGSLTEALTADSNGFTSAPLENRTQLIPRSLEYCNSYWPNRITTGTPRFYADYDYNNFLIVAPPAIAYPFELVMYAQPEFLSETNTQNWWTMYSRDMLLYACLLEAAPYLKNDQRIQVWQDRYDRAAKAIIQQSQERMNDGTIKRMD